ncbi:hypothetical protein ACVIIV_002881 [Bradyrhizobium sp. USDA 4354]
MPSGLERNLLLFSQVGRFEKVNMPVGLETWRTSGECCKYGTALGALTLEMIGKKFEWPPESSSAVPIVQLSAPS